MKSQTVTITNPQGLHMRPANVLAQAMGKYNCDVYVKFNNKDVNAKSVMNLIAACIKCGSEIELVCNGADEEQAFAEAMSLIEGGFGE